jgi:hypothetical protein
MSTKIPQFAVADPRDMDGTPFEVAARAVAQARALTAILIACVDGANKMALNAEMERQMVLGGEPDAVGWELSAQGRKFERIEDDLARIRKDLEVLGQAAAYDPKNPPKPA